MLAVLCLVEAGSSPLTRGKLTQPKLLSATGRLIPTHAGKTLRGSRPPAGSRAHPHSHGENSASMRLKATRQGSSPLTRGKLHVHGSFSFVEGLIPAHAGKTRSRRWPTGPRRAHPRSHGENNIRADLRVSPEGSSPLTRGKPSVKPGCRTRAGLIPAHAGKTTSPGTTPPPPRAHPRSRGENSRVWPCFSTAAGSSPLTRGKRSVQTAVAVMAGLIPAHAGKTTPGAQRTTGRLAHPRSRGENHGWMTEDGSWMGSSPLTRGKRRDNLRDSRVAGLIPAHAGKTTGW